MLTKWRKKSASVKSFIKPRPITFACSIVDSQSNHCNPRHGRVLLDNLFSVCFRCLQVYEEAGTSISLEESINSFGSSQTMTPHGTMTAKFRTAVSRAFGSIYVFAEPSFSASKTIPRVVMARASDQELMLLLSANWMEK